MKMKSLLSGVAALAFIATGVMAEDLTIVHGAIGRDQEVLRGQLDQFEADTGHTVTIVSMPESSTDQFGQYRLWLAAQSSDIDVYRLDVIWAPQLASHFIDMNPYVADIIGDFVPAAVESQTVNGKLVALPFFLGAPALYYRSDLLEKYGEQVPATWQDMTATAQRIMDAERAAGNDGMYGFVFQGAAYEGLTCNAQEWVNSFGGGRIVELDGSININNEKAAEALTLAASWVGGIAPEGVLNYKEEDARGVFQSGNSVFMRNWNYAYALSAGEDSPVRDIFAVTTLPSGGEGTTSAATLGGSSLGVSAYSEHQDAAVELVQFLTNYENQKERAIVTSRPPTLTAVYDDAEVAELQEFIPLWKPVVDNALPRPSAATLRKYNEVSAAFWTAVHNTMSGDGTAEENLAELEIDLTRLRGPRW
ncbi:ABC transporter substrate-binding protein [Falsihalocynthiibacter arcticus]|uniref:ABC transporter substrate-binding protein n=1 Tax=Falsihalocynthiibacter arcticus TaxID=1579316 RepID=A0A126V5A8_9RHOB|nr:ABC transporter substrate-binding protein [Falsihalocynthiibacter arcticus]AML53337.1 ABC transporter substrate-binding protein [Falsihalocynthiibacter arcticus]